MKVLIARETAEGECRVAATPKSIAKLIKLGFEVTVETGAGDLSSISDSDLMEAGAKIGTSREELYDGTHVVLRVQPPVEENEWEFLTPGVVLIATCNPYSNLDLVRRLSSSQITSFSLDLLPRIARAQAMDVLSSMSTLTGYKSVLLAANVLKGVLPLLTTAAGTLRPAEVLILGAGVAGLQAIATARRLGAVVKAFDVRPVVKEQVESLGAEFLDLSLQNEQAEDAGGYAKEQTVDVQKQQEQFLEEHISKSDIVITTALIPGKPAPVLITERMVNSMKSGSVVVDLAAEQGGNCELTDPGQQVVKEGVTLIGTLNLPSTLPAHASLMYANNIANFLAHICKDGELVIDHEDEITHGTLVTHNGNIVHETVEAAVRADGQ